MQPRFINAGIAAIASNARTSRRLPDARSRRRGESCRREVAFRRGKEIAGLESPAKIAVAEEFHAPAAPCSLIHFSATTLGAFAEK